MVYGSVDEECCLEDWYGHYNPAYWLEAEFRLSKTLADEYATMKDVAHEHSEEKVVSELDIREVVSDIAVGVQRRKQMYQPFLPC
jgi:hypothetical protein